MRSGWEKGRSEGTKGREGETKEEKREGKGKEGKTRLVCVSVYVLRGKDGWDGQTDRRTDGRPPGG